MISDIRQQTSNKIKQKSCIRDFSLSGHHMNLTDVETLIKERTSFRMFNRHQNRLSLADITAFCTYIEKQLGTIFRDIKEDVEIYVIDNDALLDNDSGEGSSIYTYHEGVFTQQKLYSPITRKSLYLQEEMHDASVVFFFVWNKGKLEENYPPRYYREINMISGFLGHQLSLKAAEQNFQGTIFAGLSPVEFSAILRKDTDTFIPLFAYAME